MRPITEDELRQMWKASIPKGAARSDGVFCANASERAERDAKIYELSQSLHTDNIAERYGLSRSTVQSIIRNERRKRGEA